MVTPISPGGTANGMIVNVPSKSTLQSLFQQHDDTDNDDDDDCSSLHNNPDDDDDELLMRGASPPALASTSSGSSSDECHDNTVDGAQRDNEATAANVAAVTESSLKHANINTNYNATKRSTPLQNNNIGEPITPLHHIPYVHGGYAAAAPLFVTHSKFASVLKRLLPGAYLELKGLLHNHNCGEIIDNSNTAVNGTDGTSDLLREYSMNNDLLDDSFRRNSKEWSTINNNYVNNNNNANDTTNRTTTPNIRIADPVKIMKWAENNPIVSAFGIWNSDNGRRTKRFMQGVVVVRPPPPSSSSQQQHDDSQLLSERRSLIDLENSSPIRKRWKERIESNRSPKRHGSKKSEGSDRDSSKEHDGDEIDQEHLTSLLQSLSTNYSSASNDDEYDLSFRDRGNSSVVEAVTNHHHHSSRSGGSTPQRLLRNYPQQQQQRKRERSQSSSSSLPPLPPQIGRGSSSAPLQSATPPPPPPQPQLLKGGGMSGPGGISSPRRKIPLPSDLPNSSTQTNPESGSGSSNGLKRSLSLTNTSYDAYLNEHRLNHHPHYNRQRTNSSSSINYLDTTTSPLDPTQSSQYHHHQQQQHYNKPAIEWDIFLDPTLVRLVDTALTRVSDLEIQLRKIRLKRERLRQQRRKVRAEKRYHRRKRDEIMKRMRMNGGGFGLRSIGISGEESEDDDDSDVSTVIDENEDFDLLQEHTAAQVEVDRLVAQLMRRTVIAHGSMSQLVLEGLGWAPEYNFGRVVKCSREGTNLPSPQRRNGHRYTNGSGGGGIRSALSFAETMSWDEEEEQRDFEALLDRRVHSSSVVVAGGSGSNGGTTGKTSHNSKGMFMEKWLSLFAKSLTLLVRSTNSSSSGGDGASGDGSSDGKSSSLSSSSLKKKKKDAQLVKKKKKKKSGDEVKKKDVDTGGVTCYLSSLFFGPSKNKSSTVGNEEEEDSDNDENDEGDVEGDTNDDDDDSAHLTNNDMFSPAATSKSNGIFGGFTCGMSLCLGMDDDDVRFRCGASTNQTSNSVFPLNPHASHQMARDIQRIHDVLGEPLRLVLDLKSRRVPPRVWSRLIDNLRSRGLIVEGIGSFDVDELRTIGKGCSYPLTPILFFHSVGDLQRACHANEVKKGDTVYFNGGSLMWKRAGIMEAAECGGCCGTIKDVEEESEINANTYERTSSTATSATTSARTVNANGDYFFQPYAYPRAALSEWERAQCKSTIEDYRRHFDLKIGVYVQEFSISAEALDELTLFVNQHGDLYDQGIAFGGVNGVAVKNISGDGYWNQRYIGRSWDFNARPSKEMTPLRPEDHHLVQVAIQAGAWGQVGTIYEVNDEQTGALTVPPPREPCMQLGID